MPPRIALDAKLPERGPARVGVIVWLVAGAIVAVLVPVFLGLVVWGSLLGH